MLFLVLSALGASPPYTAQNPFHYRVLSPTPVQVDRTVSFWKTPEGAPVHSKWRFRVVMPPAGG